MSAAVGQHSLREQNLATVVAAIYQAPNPPSRAGVAERTGLTKATVSALVTRLIAAGIVAELPLPAPRGVGRPGVPLAPARRSLIGLGLEVSAGYYGGRIVDLAGDVVAEQVVPADLSGSTPRTVLRRVGELARRLAASADGTAVAGVRLAIPGLVRVATGMIEVAPNLGWRSVDAIPMLGLDQWGVEVWNEAKLAGLAQTSAPEAQREGTAQGPLPGTFVYVSGGVGIGSAIVIDGSLYEGRHGWSGEIGHVTVDPGGPLCRCGNRGCLECYAGQDAIAAAAGLAVGSSADAIAAAVDVGDPGAIRAIARASEALGQALADYLNLVDVDTVVLGGSYARLFAVIAPAVEERLASGVLFARHAPITLVPAPQRDNAAMTGGARAVLHRVLADPAAWM